MKAGGTGGANTNANGLRFEARADLSVLFEAKGYTLTDCPFGKVLNLKGKPIGLLFTKGGGERHGLYRYLGSRGVDHTKILSKRLLPDGALLNTLNGTLYIIEMKFQAKDGSVDEKLQTCNFKKGRYLALCSPIGIKVHFIYVLNDWFKDQRYKDTLNYVEESQCAYFYNEVPPEVLGLPT